MTNTTDVFIAVLIACILAIVAINIAIIVAQNKQNSN